MKLASSDDPIPAAGGVIKVEATGLCRPRDQPERGAAALMAMDRFEGTGINVITRC